MLLTTKTNWNVISSAPETHKNDLLKNLIEQNQICDINFIENWISKEFFNTFTGIISLFQSIKQIENSIVIYVDISENGINEFTVTSKIYQKDILDKIINLILNYEDKTGIELLYYYIAESEMKISEDLITI